MLGLVSSLYGSAYNQYGALASLGSLTGVGQVSSIGSGSSVTALNRQESSYQVKLSAYGKLQSSLDTFKSALSSFKTAQDTAPFKAASGTTATLAASAGKNVSSAGSYEVGVSQLAKAQTLTSSVIGDKDSTILGTGSLTIKVGSYSSASNAFNASSSKTISIGAGDGTLSGIANAINKADAGVKASVVQVNGGYQLSLSSNKTGTENSLSISVSDNDNSDGDLSGLSALAYDPTKGPSGYSKNLNETTAAQNALLTVNGSSVTSQSNSVTTAINGVTLDLNAVGTSKVTLARDGEAFASSAQKFVDAYNALQKSFKELGSSYGAPLASDGLFSRVAGDIGNSLAQASYGVGNDRLTLSSIGINKQSDGTLALDKTQLQSALASSPDNAASLLSSAAGKLAGTAARDNGSNSELQYTTTSLNKALQSVQSRKALLQDYSQQSYFGLPAQPPLSSYISSYNTAALAGRYSQVSNLI
jgi:flagellar hook-associated protein 2